MGLKLLLLKYRNKILRYLSPNISKTALLAPRVQILGIKNVQIKDHCTIGESTILTVNNRASQEMQIIIGTNTYIGRDNFFSAGKLISVGDYCIFGNKCSFVCSDHIFSNPLVPYAYSGYSLDKTIKIGANCWFGQEVSIIGNVRIGHGCVIGAKTLITKDIPPFSMVVGNPARIIKRFDFDQNNWVKNDIVKESIYFDEVHYLEYIRGKFGVLPNAFHSSSSIYGDI